MHYLVTGATGFIGRRLVRKLLERRGALVFVLVREESRAKVDELLAWWGADRSRVIPIIGSLTQAGLGLSDADRQRLTGEIRHLFHLAAVYDLTADMASQQAANVEGTKRVVELANAIGAQCFHHMSSIAAAGLFEGIFREDMFEEAENLGHPYFGTKHQGERIVREACRVPWRIYRPGIVVGDSRTGEIDKADGPYYFFKPIQKMRRLLPPWMPTVGLEGGRINLVPVDFVVNAVDHIAHQRGLDGKCFHLVDPHPHRVGDVLAIFAKAAHAPEMAMRVNAALFEFIPLHVRRALLALTPVQRIRHAIMQDLGLPQGILTFVNYPTRFDSREAQAALAGSGIEVPPLESYAWRLWDYWERHLDPELKIDRSLKGAVRGKVVLVTGGSSGIGLATAHRLAAAGATTIIVARDAAKLEAARREIEAKGHAVIAYSADIADAEQCTGLLKTLSEKHGPVDILINNAGRSIRRAIESSYDRFHDFERCMAINYYAALRLTLGLLPGMRQKGNGHVINISSIGVLTNAPRFSAYVASKAALEAWTRCAASEFADVGIEFTIINMPLVKTPMIAPTRMYEHVPTLTPDEAAGLVAEAIVNRPVRIAGRLGIFGQVVHAVAPKVAQIIMNTSFRMFPESAAAQGKPGADAAPPTPDQVAFSQLLRGIHF
ncbi:MAG TPA: SDR family oxidoreductase [Burkholderiales bacterium]|jgi:NAD(P)-dependent dehydrogenase (short-subunit alcohol dehydrogenase family)